MRRKLDRKTAALIFSGIAVVGVGVSNVLTAIRSPKYKEILKECNGSKAKAIMRIYWPSFVAGSIAVTGIVLAERINLKEIAAITGVCSYLTSQRDKIISAVKTGDINRVNSTLEETTDPEMEKKVRYYCKAGPSVEETDRGDLLCFEGYSGRWFRSSEEAVNRAIKEMRDRFNNGEPLSYNDFYAALGIAETHFGHDWGWTDNPDYYDEAPHIEATYFDTGKYIMSPIDDFLGIPVGDMVLNDEPILVIDVYTYPMQGWMEV